MWHQLVDDDVLLDKTEEIDHFDTILEVLDYKDWRVDFEPEVEKPMDKKERQQELVKLAWTATTLAAIQMHYLTVALTMRTFFWWM